MKKHKPDFYSAEEYAKIENRKKYQFLYFSSFNPEAKTRQKIIKASTIYEAIDKFIEWKNTPKRVSRVLRVDYEVAVGASPYLAYIDITDTKLKSLI